MRRRLFSSMVPAAISRPASSPHFNTAFPAGTVGPDALPPASHVCETKGIASEAIEYGLS
jgi:hypothetical protein